MTLYPDAGLGIVVLSNAFPTGVPEGIADSFFDLVFDGRVSRDWVAALGRDLRRPVRPGDRGRQGHLCRPAAAADPGAARPARYVGTYANAYVGEATVSGDGGTLTVRLGPDGATAWPLTHFDRDLFLYYPDAGDARHALGRAASPSARTAGPRR